MSLISKIVAFAFLSGAFASDFEVAPVSLDLNPIGNGLTRRQVAAADSDARLKYSSQLYGYTTPVKIGAGTYNLHISIQDADTWVVSNKAKCGHDGPLPPDARPLPPLECKFGPKYPLPGTFQELTQDGFKPVLEGPSWAGQVGYDSVTVGGVTVPQQVIGVVNDIASGVDDTVSGGLGLGTSSQTDMGVIETNKTLVYKPIVDNMIANRLIKAPVFSLALTKDGGSLAFGGLPRSVNVDANSWASAPAEVIRDQSGIPFNVVKADGIVLNGASNLTQLSLTYDLNAPATFFRKQIADQVNKAIFGSDFTFQAGQYVVRCDTKPSGTFGIVLGGKTFTLNEVITDNPMKPNECVSVIGAQKPFFAGDGALGPNFFKSLVVVFDRGNNKVHFAHRQ